MERSTIETRESRIARTFYCKRADYVNTLPHYLGRIQVKGTGYEPADTSASSGFILFVCAEHDALSSVKKEVDGFQYQK